MATYSNQHWLLSHIRNSFISTDDSGICEAVMLSDDLPKHFLRKYQPNPPPPQQQQQQQQHNQQHRKSTSSNGTLKAQQQQQQQQAQPQGPRNYDTPLQEVDYVCYPGLDQSDDEDIDISSQSFDIQMYPEVGAHRFRSNTAQKLEKMDIARRRAARTKCVNFDDEEIQPERSDLFVRKPVKPAVIKPKKEEVDKKTNKNRENESEKQRKDKEKLDGTEEDKHDESDEDKGGGGGASGGSSGGGVSDVGVKSKLSFLIANTPKQAQNKFMEYARFDGTSHSGIQTKRIHVFLSMLPERERNYPIKICVIASAKIIEVIGLVCYKATIQFPDVPLKSIRHYALYMTEDNDDLEDFPPLDNREPCSKFGFSHLTLAERRPLAPVTRIDYQTNFTTKSVTSEEERTRLAAAAIRSLQGIDLNGSGSAGAVANIVAGSSADTSNDNSHLVADTPIEERNLSEYEKSVIIHDDMLEAPMYRTYKLHIIDKKFFKTEVTLGISGERIEIDQHKNAKFWNSKKALTFPIDSIAFCEITETRISKTVLRIWLKSNSSTMPAPQTASNIAAYGGDIKSSAISVGGSSANSGGGAAGGGGGGAASGSVATGAAAASSSSGIGCLPHSPNSPGHYPHHHGTPFNFFTASQHSATSSHHSHIRFKHYDFETTYPTAEHIRNKLNFILEVRSSEVRREFLHVRERKLEKAQAKKSLKL